MLKLNAFQPETKTTNNLASWLARARALLIGKTDQVSLEATLLASFGLQRPRTWILAHPDVDLDARQVEELDRLLERLILGEPLSYLTGVREFYGLEMSITQDVLVPRPETELLIEQALDWLQFHPGRRRAIDVGTGSGCIAVVLAKKIPNLRIVAVDRSYPALQVASRNATYHQVVRQLMLVQSDLLTALSGPFDLVCANLPYIPTVDVTVLQVSRFEPFLALDGGKDGLDLIRGLITQLPTHLSPGGMALLEIEYRQGEAVCALAHAVLPDSEVKLYSDLAGLDRLVQIQTKNESMLR